MNKHSEIPQFRVRSRTGEPVQHVYSRVAGVLPVALLTQGQDGLWYPANAPAELLCELVGLPHLPVERWGAVAALGFRLEAKQVAKVDLMKLYRSTIVRREIERRAVKELELQRNSTTHKVPK